MYPIDAYGSEAAAAEIPARPCQGGELIGCFGLTEPDAGAPTRGA